MAPTVLRVLAGPSRPADGVPDLQGYWAASASATWKENLEEHPETMDGSGGRRAIVDPPDSRIPDQPWAAGKRDAHFMRRFFCLVAVAASAVVAAAQGRPAKTLDIYIVDVEGGNATLVVSPSGGSLLIDAGNAGAGASRDAGRIIDATKTAGLTQIDHMVITHWHGDHFRALHLGDLTSDREYELVCPTNRIGRVDVLLGLHHGQDTSNSEPFVHAVRPRVAIMNNGTRKGGWPGVMNPRIFNLRFEHRFDDWTI